MNLFSFISKKINKYKEKYLKIKNQNGSGTLWGLTESRRIAVKIDANKIKWLLKWNILLFIYIILELPIGGHFKTIDNPDKKLIFSFFVNKIEEYLTINNSSQQFIIRSNGGPYPHITSVHKFGHEYKNWHYTNRKDASQKDTHYADIDEIIPLVKSIKSSIIQLIFFGSLYVVDTIIEYKELITNALFFSKFYKDNINNIFIPPSYIDEIFTPSYLTIIEQQAQARADAAVEAASHDHDSIVSKLPPSNAADKKRKLNKELSTKIKTEVIAELKNNFNNIIPFTINFRAADYKDIFIHSIQINIEEFRQFLPLYKKNLKKNEIDKLQRMLQVNIEEYKKAMRTKEISSRSKQSKSKIEVSVEPSAEDLKIQSLEEAQKHITQEIARLNQEIKELEEEKKSDLASAAASADDMSSSSKVESASSATASDTASADVMPHTPILASPVRSGVTITNNDKL